MPDLTSYLSHGANDVILTERKDAVLLRVCELGLSFPTELARDTDLRVEDINTIIYHFKKEGFIAKLHPDPECSVPQFRGRLLELNSKGIVGLPMFSKFSWWTLTKGGFEYLKIKYGGQHKRIKGSLIVALGLIEEENNGESNTI